MVVTEKFVQEYFPLHYFVWTNNAPQLQDFITSSKVPLDFEVLDPRGRTPLFLATELSHFDCVKILLEHDADTNFEHSSGWTVVHEAVCSGNPELLGVILNHRDIQRRARRAHLIPELLRRLKDVPDFYVEMKWEFASWVPLVTRMCPTNAHRVYKMGSFLRIDTSDVGFETQSWEKDATTMIFQGRDDCVKILEVDHSSCQVFSSVLHTVPTARSVEKTCQLPDNSMYENTISQRLSNPAIISFVNLEKIAFERNKTGIWGWGSDKSEKVNNYHCKVFAATNVELVTKMRYEHLAEADKSRNASSQKLSHLQKILNSFASEEAEQSPKPEIQQPRASDEDVRRVIPLEEYFDKEIDLGGAGIGNPKEMKTKLNKFKATVWLSEEYPLNLQEQVMPIVDIMAFSRSQFGKLKDFIQMQIPAGFPVKIEIPLFHLVNACITFHNIFAMEDQVPGVSHIQEESGRLACILEEDLFEPPPHYVIKNSSSVVPLKGSDEDLFQWTTEENREQMDIYQALNAPRTLINHELNADADMEEQLLQRAIEESLMSARFMSNSSGEDHDTEIEGATGIYRTESMEMLQKVLDLSREEVEHEAKLRKDEEEALKRALELSLLDK